jgi:hypothetical protein
MNTLHIIHDRLQIAFMLFMIVIGIWGCALFFMNRAISGDFWGALAIGEGLVIIEAIVGILLYINGARPARDIFHILYGVVAFISIPGTFAFTRGRDNRFEALIYGLMGFFLMGIALRTRTTAMLVP